MPAGVLIADGVTAVRGGPVADAVGLAAGIALPLVSARGRPAVVAAATAVAAVVAVAATGALEPLLP